MLAEQRAEVLPNVRGLDGAGCTVHVQFITVHHTYSVFIALTLPETNAFLTKKWCIDAQNQTDVKDSEHSH